MRLRKKIMRILFSSFKNKTGKRIKEFASMRALIATDENRKNGIFDADWYENNYPDVLAEGQIAFDHYMNHGYMEGRNPGPNFDTRFYMSTYPDVGASGVNPLLHYVLHGQAEGRQCKRAGSHDVDLPKALHHGIVKELALVPGDDAAILITHASGGGLKPHVQSYIEQLSGTGLSVLLVTVTDQPLELFGKKVDVVGGSRA